MTLHSSERNPIATSSVEEGLDFACNLLADALSEEGRSASNKAPQLLSELAYYIQYRYAGEVLLALDCLAGLGRACSPHQPRGDHFWLQIRWVASQLALSSVEIAELGVPDTSPPSENA
jgi:hypothetical protein